MGFSIGCPTRGHPRTKRKLSDPRASRKHRLLFFRENTADRIILGRFVHPGPPGRVHCISSVTGAKAAAYFLSVPPGRGCRASLYVLSPKFIVDVWVAGLLPEKKICCAASATFSRPSPRKGVDRYFDAYGNFVLVVQAAALRPER